MATEERLLPKTGSTPYTAIAHVDQYSWCLNDEDDHDGDDGNDHDNDDDDDHDENDGDDHVCDGKDLKSKQDYLMAKKRGLIEIDPNLNVLERGEQKYENTAHRWKWQWWLRFGDDNDENFDDKYIMMECLCV